MDKDVAKLLIYIAIFVVITKIFLIYGLIRTDILKNKEIKKVKYNKIEEKNKKRIWQRNHKE